MLNPRTLPLAVGDAAPDFTITDHNRQPWTLSEAVKKSDVVLCFFPLAFTSVCSTEMKCVTDEMTKWEKKGAQVVGISCDSFASLKAWADQLGLKQTLLSDIHRQVCRAYGLYWPELNVSSRGTVIIGKSETGQGKVKWVQSRQPGNAMNFEEVIASVG
ncbi:MAG: redoxin domain-containing protein [Planctomycetota bacterium]|nr:redoxin domain-containing protein [Planctomycetota bacterium]